MRRLTTADNLLIATLWLKILEGAGLKCQLRNRFIGAAAGDVPVDQVSPEIWVEEADFSEARTLLAELRNPPPLAPWHCPQCGEVLEAQFYACWHCGTRRT